MMYRFFSEKGSILIITFVLIFILVSFSTAFFFPSSARANAVQFDFEKLRALNIAEAGLANAMDNLKKGFSPTLGSELNPLAYDNGFYYTTITMNFPSEGRHLLFSTGRFQRATAALRTTVSFEVGFGENKYKPQSAFIANGDLTISGNPKIQGNKGSIFSNKKITIPGDPTISKDLRAVEALNISGGPTVGGDQEVGMEPEPVPDLTVEDYQEEANYILKNDGKVYDASGTLLHDASTAGPFQHWKLTDYAESVATWDYEGNDAIDGLYYIEGHVKIGGSPGSSISPWKLMVIATGHIEISGSPFFTPLHGDGVMFLAGTDLKINGNATVTDISGS